MSAGVVKMTTIVPIIEQGHDHHDHGRGQSPKSTLSSKNSIFLTQEALIPLVGFLGLPRNTFGEGGTPETYMDINHAFQNSNKV